MVREAGRWRFRSLAFNPVPRYFSLVEAESLLPQIESLLRLLLKLKLQHDEAEAGISAVLQRITLSGGMIPNREHVIDLRAVKETAGAALKSAMEEFDETGCQLKDLNTGLVDFPTLYRGQEVYLCWRLGETGINFWHRIEDGFRGREKIDSDFLANHRSTLTH